MTPPKETNIVPVTNPKEMEIHEWTDKVFFKIIINKLSEIKENTDN